MHRLVQREKEKKYHELIPLVSFWCHVLLIRPEREQPEHPRTSLMNAAFLSYAAMRQPSLVAPEYHSHSNGSD